MKNIFLIADAAEGGGDGAAKLDLQAKLDAANKKIADYEKAAEERAAAEGLIQEKMARGLSRAQAIGVIERKRIRDARNSVIAGLFPSCKTQEKLRAAILKALPDATPIELMTRLPKKAA
jgi:hypothetical protein